MVTPWFEPHEDAKRELNLERSKEAKRRTVSAAIGRPATDADIEEYDRKLNAKIEEDSRRKRLEEARLLKEVREKEEARKRSRGIPHDGYTSKPSINELRSQSENNIAYCEGVTVEGSEAASLKLEGDFEGFNFDRATFRNVTFGHHARFRDASFVGARFENVRFLGKSDFEYAFFRRATFSRARFDGSCRIRGASFEGARFETEAAINFDHNNVTGATFRNPRQDKWHSLSKSYTTLAQLLNTLLPIAYFAIILGKLHLFRAISRTQSVAQQNGVAAGVVATDSRQISAFEFVFPGENWFSLALVACIFVYQVLRFYLTTRIVPLMDAERQSGFTPEIASFEGYVLLNTFARYLAWIAIGAFCFELYALFTEQAITIPLNVQQGPSIVGS